ncbi:MAG: hypothetical protein JXX29_00725 [Deltaproteobacteria bacterium]|nr:hypothetical protein [Deltaproteobacteria bacterium]MBN2670161.1 hypothetical protein [Deltaproteobacteria bacterium]
MHACTVVDFVGRYHGDTGVDSTTATDSQVDTESQVDTASSLPTADECETKYSTALFCEGFENGLPTNQRRLNGTLNISTTQVHTGSASLQAITHEANSISSIVTSFPPMYDGTLYYRVYVYLHNAARAKLIGFEGVNPDNEEIEDTVDISITDDHRLAVYNHNDIRTFLSVSQQHLDNEWFCMHGKVEISQSGLVDVGINGTSMVTTDRHSTVPEHGCSAVAFGIVWSGEVEIEKQVFIDNIVVDSQPVACD